MRTPQELEAIYQSYIKDLTQFIPDGIIEVNLSLLHELGLLSAEEGQEEDLMTQSFYVIESPDKLTLFNQKFIVWIVPKMIDDVPTTYTLIAIDDGTKTRLEMVFTTAGVYNHSNLVLRILEKFLEQIEENEKELVKFKV